MDIATMKSFVNEFAKIARTRAQVEASRALAGGDTGTLRQIGEAHKQLGLSPREVGELGGGAEGKAHLMLGGHPSLPGESYHVAKYYNPASIISRGGETTNLLMEKQKATKALQDVAKDKVIIPAMGGVDVKSTPVGLRHRSIHEFVPDISGEATKKLHGSELSAMGDVIENLSEGDVRSAVRNISGMRSQPLEDTHKALLAAGKKTGVPIGDVIVSRGPGGFMHAANEGNLVGTARGKPAILDVLPMSKSFLAQTQELRGSPQYAKELEALTKSPKTEFFRPSFSATVPEIRTGLAGALHRGKNRLRNLNELRKMVVG